MAEENRTEMEARPYQLEIVNYVCQRNGIIYLPTGSGKTYIAILALKRYAATLQGTIASGGKRAVFMCNTVELARQQARCIKKTTNLKVGLYIGDRDVDNWIRRKWEEEIAENQVLCGTAQIFVDIVQQNLIKITDFSIIIIDECHHATGSHPMHNFLSMFQYVPDQTTLPRVIGLTGVLIKGNKLSNVAVDLKKLEATFRGNIVTVSSMEQYHNVMVYSTKPMEELVPFSAQSHVFNVETKVKNLIADCQIAIDNHDIGTVAIKLSKSLGQIREPNKKSFIKNLLNDFVYQMDDFGLYPASIAIMSVIVKLEVSKRQAETLALRNLYRLVIQYCERIRHLLINEIKGMVDVDDDDTGEEKLTGSNKNCDTLELMYNFCKPKMLALFTQLLTKFSDKNAGDVACLIFVERRYTAKLVYHVLQRFIEQSPRLKDTLRPQFMVGRDRIHNGIEGFLDAKWSVSAVEDFHSKVCNVIVCSNVLEEGIDVQACNYVLVLDTLKTFNSYIQTKGRARSTNSYYTIFSPKTDQQKTIDQIRKYRDIHEQIKTFLLGRVLDRDDPTENEIAEQFVEIIPPYVTPSGATLLATSALALIHRYCQSLPWDVFGASQPWYNLLPRNRDNLVAVSVSLPLQSNIREPIRGDYMKHPKEAKMSAAFNACIKLYETGKLNESLLPITKTECIAKVSDNFFSHWKLHDDDVTKRLIGKQLQRIYDRDCPKELFNSLPQPGQKCYAYCIQFFTDFAMNPYNEHIVNYLGTPNTYAILVNKPLPKLAEMPLFMSQGKLRVQIAHVPLECVIQHQEQIDLLKNFHTMIFKDLLETWKEFLTIDHRNEENSYLIVPTLNRTIDWQLIKKFQKLEPKRFYSRSERANKQYNPNDFLNKVITKWYSDNQFDNFVVTKILHDMTPLSPFPIKTYGNYATYFANQYNAEITNTRQFLIEVKALTKRRIFFNNATNKSVEINRQEQKVVLIPELCHNYNYPGDLWLKALFLPTILHRVYYMLHAEAMRCRINKFLDLERHMRNYTPKPLIVDASLKRAIDDDGSVLEDKEQKKSVLPSLPTKQLNDEDYKAIRLDDSSPFWKSYEEPVDMSRALDRTYPIEIDYYSKFISGLATQLGDLALLEEEEWSKNQFDVPKTRKSKRKPNNGNVNQDVNFVTNSIRILPIKDVDREEKTLIGILKKSFEPDSNLKSLEQYEMLAAITTSAVGDVFDMERYELLGDAFLKFSVSLYLANKYPSWNEGFLSTIKGRLVSNRNLVYCMMRNDIIGKICGTKFEPNKAWLPPMAGLPANLLQLIRTELPCAFGITPSDFYGLELTPDEIRLGKCQPEKLAKFAQLCSQGQKLLAGRTLEIIPNTDMNIFLYKDMLRDKNVADCLEAILGVCVYNYGLHRSFRMLDFFNIIKPEQEFPLNNLLDLKLSSAQLRTNISSKDIDGFLVNCEYLERNLGYKFRDRAYLLQALTHPSYPTNRLTGCYQELEFIGDAILDMLITCHIFERNKNLTPGKMTDLRTSLVNNITLGCVCVRFRFHLFMLFENAALAEAIGKFVKFQESQKYRVTDQVRILMEEKNTSFDVDLQSSLNEDNEVDNADDDIDMDVAGNGRALMDATTSNERLSRTVTNCYMSAKIDVPKALGDVVEALIAAVYLDSRDLEVTWGVIYHLMETEINEFSFNVPIDPVRQLHEIKQANPKYTAPIVENDVVMVQCIFNCLDKSYTTNGFGSNALQAKKAASKHALQIFAKQSN